jgi:hypothetical protein
MLPAMFTRTAAALVLLVCSCTKGQSGPDEPPAGGKMCTQIGCIDGLNIEVAKKSMWWPGEYTFAFVLDDQKVTCTGALPLKPCEAGPSITCDVPDKVQIIESGCALDVTAHGWGGIHVPSTPARVELSIVHGDHKGELLRRELAPKYTKSRPNGPDCEPECTSATERIELD